jgi:phosphoenolpyruvate carboxykinase (ATP)
MKIGYTRAMVHAALDGRLAEVETRPDPVFGVHVPVSCPGVPDDVLNPRNTWADKDAYDRAAQDLAERFRTNFAQYDEYVTEAVRAAGPGGD